MFTVRMALGSRELAGHGGLVTRLGAAVLCVNETGVLPGTERCRQSDAAPVVGPQTRDARRSAA